MTPQLPPQPSVRSAAVKRTLLGFPLGIALSSVFALIFSLAMGDGSYYPVALQMLVWAQPELLAVIAQTVLCGLLGSAWAGTSVLFDLGDWSLARRTIVHLAIMAPVSLVVALACGWMPPVLSAVALYLAIWVVVYLIIWLSVYLHIRAQVKKLNARLP